MSVDIIIIFFVGGIAVSTREGRGIANFETTDRVITMKRYRLGKRTFGKLTLFYRPRHILQELGIVDKAWQSPAEIERSNKNIKKEILLETEKEKENSEPRERANFEAKSEILKQKSRDMRQTLAERDTAAEQINSLSSAENGGESNSKMSCKENVLKNIADEDEIGNIKNRLRSRTKDSGKLAEKKGMENEHEAIEAEVMETEMVENISKTIKQEIISKTIKQEKIHREDKYNSRVESVISELKNLGCSEQNMKKLFCVSPSVQVKRELITGNEGGCMQIGKVRSLFTIRCQ